MYLTMLKSKLHRATITEANIDYVGSITIDKDLLDRADILPGEKVQIVDINNGQRFETYTIEGEPGSGIICVNGAAARLVQPKDKIIIISYAMMDREEAKTYQPKILQLGENNRVQNIESKEIHGQEESN